VGYTNYNAENVHSNISDKRDKRSESGREHKNAIRTNKQNSKFAQHILETRHNYDTIDQIMKILHIEKIGPKLNTLERFHKYDMTEGSTNERHIHGHA
jgi:hypothetical protein